MKPSRICLLPLLVLGLLSGLPAPPAAGHDSVPTASAATPGLALVPRRNPNPVSGIIDLDVEVRGVVDLGAFQMDVTYDPAFVTAEAMSVAPFLGQVQGCDPNLTRCAIPVGPAHGPGRVRFGSATYGAPAGASGDGVVAVLHLRPTGAVGTTALTVEGAVLADVLAVPTVPDAQGATLILWHGVYLPLVLRN